MKRGSVVSLVGRDMLALDGGRPLLSNKSFWVLDALSSGQSRPAKHISAIKDDKKI